MLKNIRRVLALLSFVAITALLLDISGALHLWLGWLAKAQFLPAVLALNFVAIAVLLLVTFVFGRIYCSVICPLGIMQDGFGRIGAWFRGKKPYRAKKEHKYVRYGVWALFVLSIIVGFHALVAILAPYGAYGRICQSIFQPVVVWINNMLADASAKAGDYDYYTRELWIRSIPTLVVAGVSLLIVAIIAIRGGRDYCNTICPVGTTLSFVSRFSLFRPVIDKSKCHGCRKCETHCKASCIDINTKTIDHSRCVDCFNCIDQCKLGALKYKFAYGRKKESAAAAAPSQTPDAGRRAFMSGAAFLVGAGAAKAAHGGLTPLDDKTAPVRKTPVTPAGSKSLKNMYDKCVACQLCIAGCPNNVLRPSSSFDHFMQPEMSFERGHCRPECTHCSEVCPAGAIEKISVAEKSSIQVGHAVWNKDLCIRVTKGVECKGCANHCPVGAISYVPLDPDDPDSIMIPAVNEERCIGCGACENLCPVRPESAIHVEGHEIHKTV